MGLTVALLCNEISRSRNLQNGIVSTQVVLGWIESMVLIILIFSCTFAILYWFLHTTLRESRHDDTFLANIGRAFCGKVKGDHKHKSQRRSTLVSSRQARTKVASKGSSMKNLIL